jgi:hypothetical protein
MTPAMRNRVFKKAVKVLPELTSGEIKALKIQFEKALHLVEKSAVLRILDGKIREGIDTSRAMLVQAIEALDNEINKRKSK